MQDTPCQSQANSILASYVLRRIKALSLHINPQSDAQPISWQSCQNYMQLGRNSSQKKPIGGRERRGHTHTKKTKGKKGNVYSWREDDHPLAFAEMKMRQLITGLKKLCPFLASPGHYSGRAPRKLVACTSASKTLMCIPITWCFIKIQIPIQ